MEKQSPSATNAKYVIGIYAHKEQHVREIRSSGAMDTSLEAQTERCFEIVRQHGFSTSGVRVFSDAGIAGGRPRHRPGFEALCEAINVGEINLVIVDAMSRISREAIEIVRFQALIMRKGARLMTVDGLDSELPENIWQQRLLDLIAQFFRREESRLRKRRRNQRTTAA